MDKNNALLCNKAIPCNSYDRHVFRTERVRAASEGPPNYQVAGTSAWYQVPSPRDRVSMCVYIYIIVSNGSKRFALNGGGLVWSCLRANDALHRRQKASNSGAAACWLEACGVPLRIPPQKAQTEN